MKYGQYYLEQWLVLIMYNNESDGKWTYQHSDIQATVKEREPTVVDKTMARVAIKIYSDNIYYSHTMFI